MKAYPITENELSELQGIGVGAAASFSVGSGLIGFSINLAKDIALAGTGVPVATVGFWGKIEYGTGALGVGLLVVGVVAFFFGKSRVRAIKAETEFD